MKLMKSIPRILRKKYNFYYKIFPFFLFISLIQSIINVSFKYPKAITLINGNILVIHQDGIDVYDSTMNNQLFNLKTFSYNEKIENESQLSKVSIARFSEGQRDNSIIVSIIINKIYFFKNNGELLYEEKESQIIDLFEGEYYDLTVIKVNGNNYSYMISFIDGSSQAYYFLNMKLTLIPIVTKKH